MYKYKSTPKSISTPKYISKKIQYPNIVILDNDECLGQFGIFSIFFNVCNMSNSLPVDMELLKKSLIKYLLSKGAARPYLKYLFKLLQKLKQLKKIDKIVMHTSAPNKLHNHKSGYIYFLKDCLEQYCNTPKLYDIVFHRNNIKAKISSCGATIKDIGNVLLKNNQLRNKLYNNDRNLNKFVNKMSKNIIMVDDKPQNINKRSGKVIGVKPYHYPFKIINIYKCIKSVPNLEQNFKLSNMYNLIFIECQHNILKHGNKINKDNNLQKVFSIILKKFNK